MQSILTYFKSNRMIAKSVHGRTKINFDAALSHEDNCKAVAQKHLDGLNEKRLVNTKFELKFSAPEPDNYNGYVWLFGEAEIEKPLHMSITVKFLPCTNTQPARMRVYSWLFPRGKTIHYGRWDGYDWETTSGCALYAALEMLGMINEHLYQNKVPTIYKLGQYIETYDGDRVFSLVE
ncbi:hypothetical protein [Providencia phage vB_PreS-PatoteraRojo]|nr:hypothetical protein [Providencia phage vB_PreS-PatoteraRojo]